MPSNACDDDLNVADATYVAALTRLANGELLLDEIIARANFIRAAKKAKWTPFMLACVEQRLLVALDVFRREARRVEGCDDAD